MMREFKSYGHCTRNENGHEEIHIDYERTFFQWLFRKPAAIGRYELRPKGSFKFWYHKNSSESVSRSELYEINRIIRAIYHYKIGEQS